MIFIALIGVIATLLILEWPRTKLDWVMIMNRKPTFDIVGKAGEIYLKRAWLLGHRASKYALMLHQMNTPDQDRFPHDHPWNFLTLVLRGGYVEETPTGKKYLRPWSIHYRPATYIHRISLLPRGKAFTLVLRWPYSRSWGFWDLTINKWHYWKNFLGVEPTEIRKSRNVFSGELLLAVNGKEELITKEQYEATETYPPAR